VVKIAVGEVVHVMKVGEWSDWTPVVFETGVPGSAVLAALQAPTSIRGMVRFYIKEIRPVLEVFVTHVNIDPLTPAVPISEPPEFATQLAMATGRYFTAGIPEHTAEIQQNALNEDQWLDKARMILDERIVQYHQALAGFESGCLFFYFGTPDQISHIFWRDQDPEHPGRIAAQGDRYSKVIEETYIKMDELVGDAMQAIDGDDTLIVMSDHGFTGFRRGFNLNTWLARNGYITRHEASGDEASGVQPATASGGPFADVDWTRTTAYGIGLNGLYVNLRGREKRGVVADDEKPQLLRKLVDELMAVRDVDGARVIDTVYDVAEDYPDANPRIAPDLLIGYARNYRAGWSTVLGEFSVDILEDNRDRWSGDHCIAAHLVPGILLSNRPILVDDPELRDLAPTILSVFGLSKPPELAGRDVLRKSLSP
jgi:predicted AlkP superfamily phosphohydrolase/phosphomutase